MAAEISIAEKLRTNVGDSVDRVLWALYREQHAKLGELLKDKSPEGMESSNWQGGKVNGIGECIELMKELFKP